jgi:hypothetical protein
VTVSSTVSAAARGRLAERLVPVAMTFVGAVRNLDADGITEFLDELTEDERLALPVILAAMVPDDRTPQELLAWVDFDEFGAPLPDGAEMVLWSPPAVRRGPSGAAERRQDYAALRGQGLTPAQAAQRLGLAVRSAARYETGLRQQEVA